LVASTLGVGRSTVYDRLTGTTRTRGPYSKADDADLLPRIRQIAAQRPTYGYRRIAAVINRQQRAEGLMPVNHKRVYRIMAADRLLLARRYTERADYGHDGVVVTIRSNLRWCSDGFEFTCWNGEVVRGAFIIDAHDREIIAWRAVANAGISGSDVRDIMLEAVETRFGGMRAPVPVEMLSDNGSAYTARETRTFARQLGLKPCFTPRPQPTVQRHLGGLRAYPQARLRSRLPAARCAHRVDIAGRMDRGLQRQPPPFRAQNAFTARASRTGFCNRLNPSGETGARSQGETALLRRLSGGLTRGGAAAPRQGQSGAGRGG
jgi:transposase InsO family protein